MLKISKDRPCLDIGGCIAIFLGGLIVTSIIGFCIGLEAAVFGGLLLKNPILGIEPSLFVAIVVGGIVTFGLYILFCKKIFRKLARDDCFCRKWE